VIVSGFDVSDRCFMADAEAGIAWCYRANMAGEFPVLEPDGQPAIVRMFGTVVIEHAAHTGKSGAALVDEAKDDSVTMAVKAITPCNAGSPEASLRLSWLCWVRDRWQSMRRTSQAYSPRQRQDRSTRVRCGSSASSGPVL
jgi:hypothetical protein